MKALLIFLLRPRWPLWRYCLVAFPIVVLPAVALVSSAILLLEVSGIDTAEFRAPDRFLTFREFLGMVVFAPLAETALLMGLIEGLLKLSKRPVFIAIVCGLLWGAAHAFFGLLRFFPSTWAFFVFSCAYLGWRQRSPRQGFVAAVVPHALNNLAAFALLAVLDAA